jgi:NAD(P)-dependent dehydrogenase (short-subunit alcohol dehydrogenase family)
MESEPKTIFITGAASGIGRATARLFAERGWFVGLYDLNREGLSATEELVPAHLRIAGAFDVRDLDAWRGAVAQFGEATRGKIHALFNNAGIARHGSFEDISAADSGLTVDVNLKGVINGVYAALPLLKQTPGARIINTASAAGIYGTPGLAVYSATKFAVRGLTEALDVELTRYGIKAICLMPWFIDTPLLDVNTSGSNRRMRDAYLDQTVYSATEAAEAVWKAAHGDDLYVTVGKEVNEARFAARFFPGALRARLKRMFANR